MYIDSGLNCTVTVGSHLKSGESFTPNHFVPPLCIRKVQKQILVSKKRKNSESPSKDDKTASKKVKPNLSGITRFFKVDEKHKPHKAGHVTSSSTASAISASAGEMSASTSSISTGKMSASTSSTSAGKMSASTSFTSAGKLAASTGSTSAGKMAASTSPYTSFTTPISTNFYVASFQERSKGMTNDEIYNLIRNVFKPDKNYAFPKTNGRSFRYQWLEMYSWLCCSPSLDGGFCLACVLFGDHFPKKCGKIVKLFSQPLRRWNDAASVLKHHAGHGTGSDMGLHGCTFPVFTAFVSNMSGATQPIEVIIDDAVKKEIEANRAKLASISDTVLLCGRLGLAFRGHLDDSQYHPEVGNYSTGGVGKFVEMLNFRVRGGDKILEDHLKSCGKNQSYISKTSQNKLIKCCGEVITDKIIADLKANKFYSIIADEAKDISNMEQMSLMLRFVDQEMNIREEFVGFLDCKYGLKGEQLAKIILDALRDFDISIADCRGQGYDGAGAVAGHINGLSAQLLRLNDKALYTHCYSHRLNLTICETIEITDVKSMLTRVKKVSDFFNISQTRQIPLEKNIHLLCSTSIVQKNTMG